MRKKRWFGSELAVVAIVKGYGFLDCFRALFGLKSRQTFWTKPEEISKLDLLFEDLRVEKEATMLISENIKELAAELHQQVEQDLTPEEWVAVQFCKAEIKEVVKIYGEAGQVALSLCAADFAAE